ncbi:hypothetical protein [uncultured Cyclobacterium sp.]|uniref:hypothetical protein n=1 Tax=uncultured Cyclobacterium sp. TaxID=453820 RepID=UPI0030ECE904
MNTLKWLFLSILIISLDFAHPVNAQENLLDRLASPIIFSGNDSVAYRDPAVLFNENTFHLYYTVVRSENGLIYSYTATSHSQDLINWDWPRKTNR